MMYKIRILTFFIFIFATSVFGQQKIDKCSPFGDVTISPNGNNELKVEVKLRKSVTETTNTTPNNLLESHLEIMALTTPGGSNSFNRAKIKTISQFEDLTRVFILKIANSNNIPNDSPNFLLPKNWLSFEYRISGIISDVANCENAQPTRFRDAESVSNSFVTATTKKDITITVGKPVILDNKTIRIALNPSETILVESVKVFVKGQNNQLALSDPDVVLSKSKPTDVSLKILNTIGTGDLEIFAPLSKLLDAKLKLVAENGSDLQCNEETDSQQSNCIWKSDGAIQEFIFTSNNIPQNIAKDEEITITTNKRSDNLKAKIGTRELNITSSNGNQTHTINLKLADLIEGQNKVTFEGTSQAERIPLAKRNTEFTITRATTPAFEKFPSFVFENGSILLKYKLKGNVTSSRPSAGYNVEGKQTGNIGNFNNDCIGNNECSFQVQLTILNPPANIPSKSRVPVILSINASETGNASKEIYRLEFVAINQPLVQAKLEEIRDKWNGKVERIQQARNDIAELFELRNPADQEQKNQIDNTMELLQTAQNGVKKSSAMMWVKTISNIFLGIAGIPIKFN